jgi:hypothetical protein
MVAIELLCTHESLNRTTMNVNLEVKLRELRLDAETGGYAYEMTTNSTYNNKRFLLDVQLALKEAMQTIDFLLGQEEVSDQQLADLLWDAEVESQLQELRQRKRDELYGEE